jgi:hypothetical protein
MHGPINVKSPNNISKWQLGFNSAFKGLIYQAQLVNVVYQAGVLGGPHGFFVVSQLFDVVDYSNYFGGGGSETKL